MKRRLTVLLLNPPGLPGRAYVREGRCQQRQSSFAYSLPPISLAYIGAQLRARGHVVYARDAAVSSAGQEILQEVEALDPDLVVFNISTPTYWVDLQLVEEVSSRCSAHLTAIGLHVTARPGETLTESRLDSVVRAEPELTVSELAERLIRGNTLEGLLGVSYLSEGKVCHNLDRPFIDNPDDLLPPDRELFPPGDYRLPLPPRPYALVVPSRGCPHDCSFCAAHLYYGRKPRFRGVGKVVDEIQHVVDRYSLRDVVMWSDCFTISPGWVEEFCREIIRRRLSIRWMCNSRVDGIDLPLAGLMKAAGCSGIAFGIESGDQEILKRMKKGTTVAQGIAAVDAAKQAGIPVLAHLVLGVPGETRRSILKSIDYVLELDPDYAQFYCAVPFPGTSLWRQVEEEGFLASRDWSRFEPNQAVISTPWLGRHELEWLRRLAYGRFLVRPRYLLRMVARVGLPGLPGLMLEGGRFLREWIWHG